MSEKWKRYLKEQKQYMATGHIKDNTFFRNFGSLSGDSCVTDIYKKRMKKKKRRNKYEKQRKNRPIFREVR